MESEPGTPKDSIIVVVHVDHLLSVGKRKNLDNFFARLEKTLKLKRVEYIENGKSALFLGDDITKYRDKVTLKSKDAHVDRHASDSAWIAANRQARPGAEGICNTRRRRDARRTRGRDVSVSRGHLDVFQETSVRHALRGKVSGNGEFLADEGTT